MLCVKYEYMKLLLVLLLLSFPAVAQDDAFRSTDLPLPRFVTVKANKAFVRAGPGKQYPVEWVMQRKGLPVEIILEFETWRKIRDVEGDDGWVHQSLLSGRRAVFIAGKSPVPLIRKPKAESKTLALLSPGVLAKLLKCEIEYCQLQYGTYKGWAPRTSLWGVYATEEVD